MTAKDFLRIPQRQKVEIEALRERAAHYRDLATHITASYSATGGGQGGTRSKVEDNVLKIVELEEQMRERIEAYADAVREVESAIDAVEDVKERQVLRYRFINGWSWRRIASKMHYDSSWVYRIGCQGMRHVVVPDDYKTKKA